MRILFAYLYFNNDEKRLCCNEPLAPGRQIGILSVSPSFRYDDHLDQKSVGPFSGCNISGYP